MVAIIVFVGLLALIVVGVKILDFKRRRETEAVHVEAQIADALLRDPRFFGLPITPIAHVPVRKGPPVRVEIAGEMPTAGLRDAALFLAKQEASRRRSDVQIDDRLIIVPARAARTA